MFSVNLEESIPTWYSTLLLFTAAMLLTVIAIGKRVGRDRYTVYWAGLAIIFVYLSIDEGAAIHEIFSDLIEDRFNTSGFLSFGWLVVAIPVVLVFGLLYLRFLLHLPTRTRNLLIVAGALYIGGAIVVESISANQYDLGGGVTLLYLAIATVEELFEMLGVVLLIYALLAYLVDMQYTVAFQPQSAADQIQPNLFNWSRRVRLLGLIVVVFMIAANIALYTLAVGKTPPPEAAAQPSRLTYQMIIDDLVTSDTVVAQIPGVFGDENLASRQVVAAMLDMFDEVMVVALPEFESSIVIAADTLPFNHSSLTDILHANGETQFIIFDPSVVRMIAG
jgi:hypothetical protein